MPRRITDIVTEGQALGVVGGVAASVPVADDQTAAEVPFTPTGGIAATNVQAALAELDTEKLASVGISNLTATGTPSATTYLRGDNTWATPAGGAGAAQLLHVQDQKAAGTAGGNSTAGTWTHRDLNTVLTNDITGASLASNAVTLPAGTYEIEASCPAWGGDRHRARLYNVTAAAVLLYGSGEYGPSTNTHTNRSFITGRFTLAVSSTVRIEHRFESTRTAALGLEVNMGVYEQYTDALFRKVS